MNKKYNLDTLLAEINKYHPGECKIVEKAYSYAEKMHSGQTRKSGDPYFIHPVRVAHTVAELGLDPQSVCADIAG